MSLHTTSTRARNMLTFLEKLGESNKAEGMTVLPDAKLFIVCDEDRSPSSFDLSSGRKVTRRPGQGVYFVVSVQAAQR
jgi:hypothetical protein